MAPKESTVDVLIVGAGAAGMMAAASAASYGMNARIIDKRPTKLLAGHGDGLHARMMEILDTFGLAKKITEIGNKFAFGQMWEQDANGKLERKSVSAGLWQPPSAFGSVTLSQARIADVLLDYVHENSEIKVERATMIESLGVEEGQEFPVKVSVRKVSLDGVNGNNDIRVDDDEEVLDRAKRSTDPGEIIRAKYVVACDGAHSWVRRSLGIPMDGDDTDVIWGVMDVWPTTNFPSARFATSLKGVGRGLMLIPRERGLIRVYTVVGAAMSDEQGKLIRSSVTPEKILKATQEMLHPYTFTYKRCEWWAAYQIGQRVATENIDPTGRIFLAGDAVHTHSPQAGQGLNVSMADTYNLMWKMNLVLKGLAKPEVLQTYREERHVLGKQLVDFDRQWAAVISGREPPEPTLGVRVANVTFEKMMENAFRPLVHGLQVMYPPSVITESDPAAIEKASVMMENGQFPTGIQTGMRMPSFQVRRHADMKIWHLGKSFRSDGRFKFVIFAGDIGKAAAMDGLRGLAIQIESVMRKYGQALFDAILVHAADSIKLNVIDLPDLFHPLDPDFGYDYNKVFYEDNIVDRTGLYIGSAYEKYEIDEEIGRLVLLRPDGYVAYQGGLGEFGPIERYFEKLLISSQA